jgi:hypothetical protein
MVLSSVNIFGGIKIQNIKKIKKSKLIQTELYIICGGLFGHSFFLPLSHPFQKPKIHHRTHNTTASPNPIARSVAFSLNQ